jgi:hypothetical protein
MIGWLPNAGRRRMSENSGVIQFTLFPVTQANEFTHHSGLSF